MDKGQSNPTIMLFIMGAVLAGIMVLLYMYSLSAPIIHQVIGDVSGTVSSMTGRNTPEEGNLTESIQNVTAPVDGVNNILTWFGYSMFFGLVVAFLIIAYNVKAHPYLSVVWVGIIIVLALIAIWMSVSYEDMKADSYLREVYESNVLNDFLMSYLPHLIVVIGLIGGVLMFLVLSTDQTTEAYQ